MPEGEVLEFSGVTKRFGAVNAVSSFSARIEPGVVTGFLGPNGAGKTTTLRILLGLVRATEGSATIGGVRYADLKHPMRSVGAVLEASSFHPGRTAANHLKVYAQAGGLPASRVDESLAAVGLSEVAGRKVGGFSLGMRQRLGLAGALLGDPGVVVLDEPANGLDPEGIIWMRALLRELARQGRTVFVSSHLLTEIQQSADSLVIIARGRRVFQGSVAELSDGAELAVLADSPERSELAAALSASGVGFENLRSGLTVTGVEPIEVGRIARDAGIALSSLQRRGPSLEEVFLDLVNGTRTHPSGQDSEQVAPVADAVEPAGAPVAAGAEAAAAGAIVGAPAEGEGPALADEPEVTDEPEAAHEPEAVHEPQDQTATDDQDAAEAAEMSAELDDVTNPFAGAAAFSVASTGVIDIVPPEDDDSGVAESDQTEPDHVEPDHVEPEDHDNDHAEGGEHR